MSNFNPIELSRKTEKIVIKGNKRKYNGFRLERFYGQIATARGVGCNLKCCFCWINPSRDSPEKYGNFYSPKEVYNKTMEISSSEYGKWAMTNYLRISGCEPTFGREHLLGVIELCAKNQKPKFLLETNGILLGDDESYVKELSKFKKYFLIRLSLKAGTHGAFEKKTGAKYEFFELPFKALRLFEKYKIDYRLASMSNNPEIMPPQERYFLFKEIIKAGVGGKLFIHSLLRDSFLEEEETYLFCSAKKRLNGSGLVEDLNNLNKAHYSSLSFSLRRWLIEKEEVSTQDEFVSKLNEIIEMSPDKLISILNQLEFSIVDSPCKNCRSQNPWHGHGVKDDLNEDLLGKFIH